MSRPLRIEYPGAWYHAMNRGRRSEKIFLSKEDYQTFVELLIEASELWKVNISAYSLMPNHYHLLINTPLGNLSRFMRHVNGVYTQRFNINHEFEGQLFKGRYKSILVDGDSYLLQLMRYIHRNSLRAGIVNSLDDYEWSSHIGYISRSEDWYWLYKEFILSIFSEDKNKKISKYREFIDQEDEEKLIKTLNSPKWPAMLGSDDFISSIKEKYFTKEKNKEIPDSKNLAPDIVSIKEVVCDFYNIDIETLCIRKRRTFNEPRNIAIHLSRYLRNDTLKQLSKDFLFNNNSSVNSALSITKELLKNDQELRKKVEKMEQLILKRETET